MTRRDKGWTFKALAFAPLAIATTLAGCHKPHSAPAPIVVVPYVAPDNVKGLRFRLSEGKPSLGDGDEAAIPDGSPTPLTDADANRVLARLKPIDTANGDTVGFALRESSLPPPRAGQTVSTTFPPAPTDGTPPAVESGPLTVRRVSPEGDVPLADRISVTFSQPMVPVTSQEEAAQNVPVTLTPKVPGAWRWLGTQTLVFDVGSGKRLPMATSYHLTIPAGTKSATGGTLASARTVSFQTPAVRLLEHWPTDNDDPQPRDPLIRLRFDQRVDADAVLKTVTVNAGGKKYAVRPATAAELAKVKEPVNYGEGDTPSQRMVAFKTVDPLPTDASVTVKLGPGTPSLEGDRVTAGSQSFNFRTYGALKITQAYGSGNPPNAPWQIEFNNPLDADSFDPATVKVTPTLPGSQISVNGSTLAIAGASTGRTTYKVIIPAALKDTFGQTLGASTTRTFTVGPAEPNVQGPSQNFFVCDPSAPPRAAFQSVNTPSIRVKLYAVGPGDWAAYTAYESNGKAVPGRLVSERIVPLKTPTDAWGETSVDVAPALNKGLGNVLVVWQATIHRKDEDPDRGAFWMQSTHLGLMAQRDATDVYAWVTDLATGKPKADASATLLATSPKGSATLATAKAANDGLARLPLTTKPTRLLVARLGDDQAFLPSSQWDWDDSGWQKQTQTDTQRWFIFDDRKLYRPGETTHIKGWMRVQTAGTHGDLTLPTNLHSVNWTLTDSRGNAVRKGTASVNAWAGFNFAVDLPKTMNTGQASLTVNGQGHAIDIEEFRRPEFEATAKNEGAGPYIVGEPKGADVSVAAKYYAGGALPGTPVTWTVTATPTTYSPPGHEGFTFGKWTPWWGGARAVDDEGMGEFSRGGYRAFTPNRDSDSQPTQAFSGKTGADGSHYLHLDFETVHPAQPYTVNAQATVQDVNRQTLSANASLIVHPSARYVGLKSTNLFVEKGSKLALNALVCDIDGKADSGRTIQFEAVRREWGYKKGRWGQNETDSQKWTERSTADALSTDFTPKDGGEWVIRATVLDDRQRPNTSELTLWVSGGDGPHEKQRTLTGETATLIPDLKEYKAGQTASILVQSPFANAEGMATVVHDGVVSTQRFTLTGNSYTLKIPIAESFLPTVGVQVELVGSEPRTDDNGAPIAGVPPRPAYASGHLDLSVPPITRQLTVTAVPAQTGLEPGGKTTVVVTVKDADGKPVANAETAVVIVDESVLALAGWNLGDPLGAFYPGDDTSVTTQHLRQYLLLEDPGMLRVMSMETPAYTYLPAIRRASAVVGVPARAQFVSGGDVAMYPKSAGFVGGMGIAGGRFAVADTGNVRVYELAADHAKSPSHDPYVPYYKFVGAQAKSVSLFARSLVSNPPPNTPIAVRENFDALAAFAPSVVTDATGTAHVAVTLPDNLTRYRIVAVAVAGAKQVGHGEASLTARLPLMARPSAPRFLNFGDKFELPVVLQNQTDAPMDVDVAVRGANLAFAKVHGQHVTVPANNRVEVRFPAEAVLPGTARFQVAAVSGDRADSAEVSLPVWTPATTEAFATYGVVDNGAVVQPVKAPDNVVPQFGGLEVTTSSTALQELTDALISLEKYPYDCAEQVSSRVLANVALKDVVTAFHAADLPKPAEMQAQMARDMTRLMEIQNDDGSFGFWTRTEHPYPYLGVHVAHALVVAKAKGYPVPATLYARSIDYLKHIDSKFDDDYTPQTRRMIRAYALYVRHLASDTDAAAAHALLHEATPDNLGPETLGWLLSVLPNDAALSSARTYLNNHATETAGAAHFAFSYQDGSYLVLNSDRRADAIVLDALIADQPKSDLIPKLVRGLLDGRKRGHWANTEEDAFVLLALDHYFHTYEGVTPNFTARLWLGNKVAGEAAFHGRTTDRIATTIPMAYLAQTSGPQNLTLDKQGAGRLYYRVGMRYAPKSLDLKPADYGFAVKRTYEAVDKPTDVRHNPDGTWTIRAGAKVRVRLSLVTTTRRYHVALTDPLPAGFEALNSELQGTETLDRDIASGTNNREWSWGNWWEYENLRDERAEAFTSLLWEGAYEYVYVCRATTPGQFVVLPAKAEEMYAPETFGRSGTDWVTVE